MVAVVCLLMLVFACVFAAKRQGEGVRWQASGQPLHENSGLAHRAGAKRGYWSIADSGSAPILYALNAQGVIESSYKINVKKSTDWEDIASDGGKRLFLADTGDNHSQRPEISVVEVALGQNGAPRKSPRAIYRFQYPNRKQETTSNYDAEGLVFLGGQLYLFTKRRADTYSHVYRFHADPKQSGKLQKGHYLTKINVARPHSWLHLGDMVTGAAIDATGRRLAVLTYRSVFVFENLGLSAWKRTASRRADVTDGRIKALLSRPPQRWKLPVGKTHQVEGLTFVGEEIYVSNEEGKIFSLREVGRLKGLMQRR